MALLAICRGEAAVSVPPWPSCATRTVGGGGEKANAPGGAGVGGTAVCLACTGGEAGGDGGGGGIANRDRLEEDEGRLSATCGGVGGIGTPRLLRGLRVARVVGSGGGGGCEGESRSSRVLPLCATDALAPDMEREPFQASPMGCCGACN